MEGPWSPEEDSFIRIQIKVILIKTERHDNTEQNERLNHVYIKIKFLLICWALL